MVLRFTPLVPFDGFRKARLDFPSPFYCYGLIDGGRLDYVGHTTQPAARMDQHCHNRQFDHLFLLCVENLDAAKLWERILFWGLSPRGNRAGVGFVHPVDAIIEIVELVIRLRGSDTGALLAGACIDHLVELPNDPETFGLTRPAGRSAPDLHAAIEKVSAYLAAERAGGGR